MDAQNTVDLKVIFQKICKNVEQRQETGNMKEI